MRPLATPRRKWEDNIKMDLKMWDRRMDLITWLRIGTADGML